MMNDHSIPSSERTHLAGANPSRGYKYYDFCLHEHHGRQVNQAMSFSDGRLTVAKLYADRPESTRPFDEVVLQFAIDGKAHVEGDAGAGQFVHSGELSGLFLTSAPYQECCLTGEGGFELICLAMNWKSLSARLEGRFGRQIIDFGRVHESLKCDKVVERLVWCCWTHAQAAAKNDFGLLEYLTDQVAFRLVELGMRGKTPSIERVSKPTAASWRRCFTRLHDDLDQPITLDQLASDVGVSTFHFTRLFKQTVGMSPIEYRTKLRIEKAQRLIVGDTTLPLAAIAFECGFSDQSHMTRLFKRVVGTTPKRWKDLR